MPSSSSLHKRRRSDAKISKINNKRSHISKRTQRSSNDRKHRNVRLSNHQADLKAEAERCKHFIYNYTDISLSDIEIIALSKGFKFIPTPCKPPRNRSNST